MVTVYNAARVELLERMGYARTAGVRMSRNTGMGCILIVGLATQTTMSILTIEGGLMEYFYLIVFALLGSANVAFWFVYLFGG